MYRNSKVISAVVVIKSSSICESTGSCSSISCTHRHRTNPMNAVNHNEVSGIIQRSRSSIHCSSSVLLVTGITLKQANVPFEFLTFHLIPPLTVTSPTLSLPHFSITQQSSLTPGLLTGESVWGCIFYNFVMVCSAAIQCTGFPVLKPRGPKGELECPLII